MAISQTYIPHKYVFPSIILLLELNAIDIMDFEAKTNG